MGDARVNIPFKRLSCLFRSHWLNRKQRGLKRGRCCTTNGRIEAPETSPGKRQFPMKRAA